MRVWIRRVLCGLCGITSLASQKKPVTIEALVETRPPTPTAVVWAPDGSRFVYREGGELWLYELASRSRRKLLALDALEKAAITRPETGPFHWENRRVREETVQWFPSGDSLLLAAGGDLFVFRLAAGGWAQLTSTLEAERDPKLSPDGSRVSFRRGNDLYVIELASRKVTQLTHDGSETLWNGRLDWVYPEELDLGTAHWWSPDSRLIAYLQFDVSRQPLYPHADLLPLAPIYEPQRYPKAGEPNADVRLGVVAAGGGPTRWMDTGETRDALLARVHWEPHSRSLLVQRLNRIQNRLELLRVTAATGERSVVFREEDPYWINVHDELRPLRDGKELLWASERDGFRHLYLYSAEGQLLRRLTSGEWEVTSVACVDEAAGEIFYVSTEPSPLERHLWRVRLDGSERKRLSREPGTHAVSMPPGCGHYLDTWSSLASPPRRTIHTRDGAEWAVFAEADRKRAEEYEILPTEIVEVKAPDGALLYARLIRPAGFRPGEKYPAVVVVYGGPHAQAVRNAWAGISWEQVMAHKGFVIWQLDNRGSAGRGHRWEAAVFRNFGARELEDQKAGLQHLLSLGFVDRDRIGIYGWSYGGYMTLYSLLHAPELFRAGVAGAPVTDWRNYDTIYTERYMGLPSENAEGYRRSSPVHFADKLKAKLLLIHNFEDDNVLFQNSLQMAAALQRAGKQFEWMIYPLKSHGVTGPYRRHMYELMTAFFERELKGAPPR
ncbi:MAG: DPP IV N-terminal domain-containing protein [Bryobacterales bacterium]|nr:S9 family peptidase [Bryobacteraceae bacterium]MDW8355761.1 DPP IV N-terminal domain-containing protein [Bryobacterales bacterium]